MRSYPNPLVRWVGIQIGRPADWLAWHVPMPERLFDRLLAFHWTHGGAGTRPTRREWQRIREAARSLPLTPRSRFEPPTPESSDV